MKYAIYRYTTCCRRAEEDKRLRAYLLDQGHTITDQMDEADQIIFFNCVDTDYHRRIGGQWLEQFEGRNVINYGCGGDVPLYSLGDIFEGYDDFEYGAHDIHIYKNKSIALDEVIEAVHRQWELGHTPRLMAPDVGVWGHDLNTNIASLLEMLTDGIVKLDTMGAISFMKYYDRLYPLFEAESIIQVYIKVLDFTPEIGAAARRLANSYMERHRQEYTDQIVLDIRDPSREAIKLICSYVSTYIPLTVVPYKEALYPHDIKWLCRECGAKVFDCLCSGFDGDHPR